MKIGLLKEHSEHEKEDSEQEKEDSKCNKLSG
jgi:hypothetical protein